MMYISALDLLLYSQRLIRPSNDMTTTHTYTALHMQLDVNVLNSVELDRRLTY